VTTWRRSINGATMICRVYKRRRHFKNQGKVFCFSLNRYFLNRLKLAFFSEIILIRVIVYKRTLCSRNKIEKHTYTPFFFFSKRRFSYPIRQSLIQSTADSAESNLIIALRGGSFDQDNRRDTLSVVDTTNGNSFRRFETRHGNREINR